MAIAESASVHISFKTMKRNEQFYNVTKQSFHRSKKYQRRWNNHWFSIVLIAVMAAMTQCRAMSTTTAFAARRRISQKQQQKSYQLTQVSLCDSVVCQKTHAASLLLRGGGGGGGVYTTSTSRSAVEGASNADHLANNRKTKRGMTMALASSLFTVMGAKCALPCVLALLIAPSTGLTFPPGSVPQQMIARQLTVATLSVAFGKLVLGPVIDHFGGKLSLQVALSFLSVLLLTISLCQSFAVFGIAWIVVDFIFSSCWPACINTIHQFFDEAEWPTQIGNLATAARAGNSFAFILFSTILNFMERLGTIRQCWRPVFFVAALAQLIPILLLSIYGKKGRGRPVNDDSDRAVTVCSSLRVLRREVVTLDFWLHLVNRSMLMIYASFLLFVPTLMTQVYKTTTSVGAQVGSLYGLGCLAAVTTLSKSFARMCKSTKLWSITLLLLFGATGSSLLQLSHVSGYIHLSPPISAILFFIWGFSFAIPFYIPPSMYALSRGGQESSATITDVFDIGGFSLLAVFNGYVAGILHDQPRAWIPTFIVTTSCSLISFLALFLATFREKPLDHN